MIKSLKLTKRFKRLKVLDEMDLSVAKGDRVALVGSNGAGKTTLIRCLLGEYTFDGDVLVAGLSPRKSRQAVLREVGFVPQLPPPLKMPVAELLRFSAQVSNASVRDMEDIASSLGLDVGAFSQQPFFKLSGGQKQKLLIAIALGRKAQLLIMDEPAANLDPEARGAFFSLLAERVNDATMIISSHRLDEVASLVNRVVELDCGKVVLDDRVSDSNVGGLLLCRLGLRRSDAAIAKSLGEWGFVAEADGLQWTGRVAAADRLRFMGLLSRYVGVLSQVSLEEAAAVAVAS